MREIYELDAFRFAEWVKTIRYGYMDADGKLHFEGDPDFAVQRYVFSSPEQVARNLCGWCWDVANLIAQYCKAQGMKHQCLFMEYNTEELHQTHTQVFTEFEGRWYAFPDNSVQGSFGEKGFDRQEDCGADFVGQFEAYLRYVLQERYNQEHLLLKEITIPIPAGISDDEYLHLARGEE